MSDNPRSLSYFRGAVQIASEFKECGKRLSDLNLSAADVSNRLFRLRHYNNEYSRVGACLPVLYPSISATTTAFENAVIARGSTLNSTERVAINAFVTAVQPIWSLLREVYPFVGSFLSGGLTPLKSTLTTATASPSLTSTYYDRTLGVLLGGSNRWIDMGTTSSALVSATASHMREISIKRNDTDFTAPVFGNGSATGTVSDLFYPKLGGSLYADLSSYSPSTNRAIVANPTVSANYVITKAVGGQVLVYKNGSSFAASTTTNTAIPPNVAFQIGRSLFDSSPSVLATDLRVEFFVIGENLNSGQVITLNNAINAFKTAIGR